MVARNIKENICSVGAVDWDRRLFDELIPIPEGTSYNAYLIRGRDKTALIDTVDPSKEKVLLDNLKEMEVDRIDYVVANHAEQDHSGTIPKVLEVYPMAKVATNPKCKELLQDLLAIPEDKFIIVAEGDKLALGQKTLEFIFTPWVHWPDTMCTYLYEDQILFSCDFFASHLATSDIFAVDRAKTHNLAKRYYAEIMMPFRTSIKKNIEKVRKFPIALIAPSHGPVYDQPQMIVDAYCDWISDGVRNEVVVPYVSMHGSTAAMVDHFVEALLDKGIEVKKFNLIKTDIGELAMALVDAATIVIGSPTVLAGPHPSVMQAAFLTNALRPKAKFASVIASYGWLGKVADQIAAMIPNLKVEIIPPVIVKGYPKAADLEALDSLAEQIMGKHNSLGLMTKSPACL